MNITFIEHAQDDVDRHQSCQNEERFVREGGLERFRRPLKARIDARRQAQLFLAASIARTASPSEVPGARLNEIVTTGN